MNAVLVLAATALVAQNARPELVTLPLSAKTSRTQPTLSAWNEVVAEFDKRARGLGVSVAVQKTKHAFLVGPAREQARDCGRDIDCLAEIGAALGADYLVIGVVSDRIALLAIRVEDRGVLAKARSPRSGPLERKAKRAAQRLARRLRAAIGPSPKKAVAATVDNEPPPPPRQTAAAPARPVPVANGLLYIHRDQLAGVTTVTLDDEPVAFTGEGFVSWPAASGEHVLRARHIDGRELVKPITLQPGQTTEVALGFALPPQPALVAAAPPAARDTDDRDVLSTWWFWTALGTAVVAGAATAAVLAGGSKGGPTPPTETGVIRGTY